MRDLASAFDRGADRYDLLVSLNPGYHAHLHSAADELARRSGPADAGLRLLDLACGSGASTRALLDQSPAGTTITGIDLSEGMLARARAKTWPPGTTFRQGRVGGLDLAALGRGSWQGVFASYLFRNVPADERTTALVEVHDLLAPGGWLVTQEYSVAGNRRARAVWDAVSLGVILPLGTVVDRNPGLYRYLWRSVRDFDTTPAFMGRLAEAGFTEIACRTVPGWQRGILHTFVARKAPA
ncbi:class I SAM-dependent methyltransferase [Aestuariimicrobium sp. Y1814]|uniref:class I SAM-dependent methyltransferase n=1 Tax=Aestuariimicrobium sp. Y1814 TaxID=3418742 RepID=UPI003DA74762